MCTKTQILLGFWYQNLTKWHFGTLAFEIFQKYKSVSFYGVVKSSSGFDMKSSLAKYL